MSAKNKILRNRSNDILLFILFCAGTLVLSSCNEQARGFALPEGDTEKGKVTYERLACASCHSVSGIAWQGAMDSLNIPLGGEVPTEKSYGYLVTSIINPSHKIARSYNQETTTEEGLSKMTNYNEIMTVQELIDLVTFLQSEYEVKIPTSEYHPYY